MNFEEFKAEIIRRAKGKYSGAFIGSLNDVIDYPSLMTVIKQEFRLLVKRQILDAPFIESHKTEFNAHGIFLNENVNNGFLLAENSPIVVARGNSIVIARDSSSVVARDGSSVEAWGSSSVEARESGTAHV